MGNAPFRGKWARHNEIGVVHFCRLCACLILFMVPGIASAQDKTTYVFV
jgi:hypothetical protein